jgi:hypothetical protein
LVSLITPVVSSNSSVLFITDKIIHSKIKQ